MYLYMYATPFPHMDLYDGFHSEKEEEQTYTIVSTGFPRLHSAFDPYWGTSTIPKDTLFFLHIHGQWLSTWGAGTRPWVCLVFVSGSFSSSPPLLVRERTLLRVTWWA